MAKKNNKSKAKAKAAPVRARDATDRAFRPPVWRLRRASITQTDLSRASRMRGGAGRLRRETAPRVAPRPSEPRARVAVRTPRRATVAQSEAVRLASLRPADLHARHRRRCVFSRSRPRPTTRRPSPRRRPARRPPSGLRRKPPRSPPVWPSTVPVRPSPTRRRGATIREHSTALLSTFGARDVRARFERGRGPSRLFFFAKRDETFLKRSETFPPRSFVSAGAWAKILADDAFKAQLKNRSNKDLSDKFRGSGGAKSPARS